MVVPKPETEKNEAFWREYLMNPDSGQSRGRRVFKKLPHGPRCQLCAMPFHGVAGSLFRFAGKRPSDGNPNVCNACQTYLIRYHGGAEVPGSMLFADIRGSTALAERISAGAFRTILDRFYSVASGVVFDHDGMVDKFVGDELVAVFTPVFAGRHAIRAVDAAKALFAAVGYGEPDGPWVPLGAGVHTGLVWFGTVGDGQHTEITVVGDPVNVTARLAAAAGAGEILVSVEAATDAGLDPSLERRKLQLKGKSEPTEVVTLRVGPTIAASL